MSTKFLHQTAINTKALGSLLCCAALVATQFAQSREAVAPPFAIARVNIVDVERGDVLRNRTVVIQGDVIDSILPGDAPVPAAVTTIDGRAGYVKPNKHSNAP